MDWNEKLLDLMVGAAVGAQGALGIEHWKKRALARLSDHNPFRSISANHDLTRAVRIAWVEAALEILGAAKAQSESREWARESTEIGDFESLARTELVAVRSAAFDRRTHPGKSPIDLAVKSVIDGVPEYIGQSADTGSEADVTGNFSATLAELTKWPKEEVPAIFAQIAAQGLAITGGGPARSFGELVFAAFAELIKNPDKYPEAREAFHIAMADMARRLSQSILAAVQGLDGKFDALTSGLDALAAIQKGAANYLETLNRISAGVVQISGDVSATRGMVEGQAAELKEMRGLLERLLAESASRSAPRQEAAVGAAVTAAAEGAAAGDARLAKALELLKFGDTTGAAAVFSAVAEEKATRIRQDSAEAAAAYRNLGAIAGLRDPARALTAYANALEYDADDLESLLWVGWIANDRGDLNRAFAHFRRVLKLAKDESLIWYFCWAKTGIGDVLVAQGDLGGALTSYRDSLAISDRLAKSDPGNAGWQRDLSVSYEKVGNVLVAQGDLGGALTSYRDSLAIRDRLAKSDPGNAGWQRDLSVSFNKVGDVLVAQGDLGGALTSYRDSLAIRDRLAKSDPGNAGWQRDLSVSYDNVGDVLVAQGDLGGALTSYRDSLAIRDRLAKSDPGNAGWQRDLSVSYDNVGDVLVAQGDLGGALTSYRDSLAISDRLAKSDPGNAGWQRDLSVSYARLAMGLRGADPSGAIEKLEKGHAIMMRLVTLSPDNAIWKRDAAWFEGQLRAMKG